MQAKNKKNLGSEMRSLMLLFDSDLPIITTTTSTERPDEEAIKAPNMASLAISYGKSNKGNVRAVGQ